MQGSYSLTVLRSLELNNPNLLSKPTPFVKVQVGSESFTTKTAEGVSVTWNQAFLFNLDGKQDKLHVIVMSKGTVSDDVIGRLDVPLKDLIGQEKMYNIVSPNDFSKTTGMIFFRAEFNGTGGPSAAAAPSSPSAASAASPMSMSSAPATPQAQPQVVMMAQPQPQIVVMQQPQPQVIVQSSIPNERALLNDLLVRAVEIDKANAQALALLRAMLARAK